MSGLMLRVSTIHASSASTRAAYFTRRLTGPPGEVSGRWSGRQAAEMGLLGTVGTEQLARLLSGYHPVSAMRLGSRLVDRTLASGRVMGAVGGFDATYSAPKSFSVLWAALTGDSGLLEAHDIAVAEALAHLERFGSTTRIRCDGTRLHPDTNGLTIASFHQTISRADDPQIDTHAVVSAKVQTSEGRWLALDGRYLKRKQRMLGGLYQSVLRSEVTHRFGFDWAPIVNGQAEIAGFPTELITIFSKRAAQIDQAMLAKIDEFRRRQGRSPTRFERAAMEREASAETRPRESGLGESSLVPRWRAEAAAIGWTAERLLQVIDAARQKLPGDSVTVAQVIEAVSAQHSSWGRPEILQAICDLQRPMQVSGRRWHDLVERAADLVLEHCVDLDPPPVSRRRDSDGRSWWIAPTTPRYASKAVLAEQEPIVTRAIEANADSSALSMTVPTTALCQVP